MSDLSAFKAIEPDTKCTIGRLPFTDEQRIIFDLVMEADRFEFPAARIIEVMNDDWGLEVGVTTLKQHRRKKCACFKGNPAPNQEKND
jgi:hypothetical protein